MKIKEAIRLLRNLTTMCEFTDAYGEPIDSDAYYDAVDMAISALQAQETINRRNKSVQNVNIDDSVTRKEVKELSKNSPKLDKENGDLQPTCNELETVAKDICVPCKDTISRQAAIDALMDFDKKLRKINWYQYPHTEYECRGVDEAIVKIENVPSAQPDGWLEQNKDKILQAGMEGREIDFRIGGRLFAIREKAQ